jgi:Mn-containing catalase
VEHYEMAGYTTAISLAKRLGNSEVVSLLSETLAEEEAADNKLRSLASAIMKAAPAVEATEPAKMIRKASE